MEWSLHVLSTREYIYVYPGSCICIVWNWIWIWNMCVFYECTAILQKLWFEWLGLCSKLSHSIFHIFCSPHTPVPAKFHLTYRMHHFVISSSHKLKAAAMSSTINPPIDIYIHTYIHTYIYINIHMYSHIHISS